VITGVVNTDREATIRLAVYDSNGQQLEFEAVIDTGFTGSLTLPSSAIATLGLAFTGRGQVVLGDGSIELFDMFTGTVLWDGQRQLVEIDAADTDPLVGMALIYGYELNIQAVDGGNVTLTRI
jgi:clan AA aspartic protease